MNDIHEFIKDLTEIMLEDIKRNPVLKRKTIDQTKNRLRKYREIKETLSDIDTLQAKLNQQFKSLKLPVSFEMEVYKGESLDFVDQNIKTLTKILTKLDCEVI